MNEAAKEARREYKRQWARSHPEMVRAAQERYWSRRAAETAAKRSAILADHDQEKPDGEGVKVC